MPSFVFPDPYSPDPPSLPKKIPLPFQPLPPGLFRDTRCSSAPRSKWHLSNEKDPLHPLPAPSNRSSYHDNPPKCLPQQNQPTPGITHSPYVTWPVQIIHSIILRECSAFAPVHIPRAAEISCSIVEGLAVEICVWGRGARVTPYYGYAWPLCCCLKGDRNWSHGRRLSENRRSLV